MTRRHAIDIAIDARTRKGPASLLSVGPLPEGVKDLLRIVAEGEWRSPATEHAYREHSSEEVHAASAAFLAAALFHNKADPYRVLGITPEASHEDLRENKRLLLKWLHPDRNPSPGARAHLGRVLEAAEAIEDGRARASTPELPPRIVVPARTKRPRRAKADPLKSAVQQIVEAVARTGKVVIVTALVTIIGLVAWRYVMNEPIGTTLERYTRLAVGMAQW